eukprot:5589774-Prymnesium_polylepis.2
MPIPLEELTINFRSFFPAIGIIFALGPGFASCGEVREKQRDVKAVVRVSRGKRASTTTTTRTPLAPSACSWQTTTSRPTIGHHRHPQ